MPVVFLIKPGSILRDGSGRILDARSSVTLTISKKRKIVVDTGLAGEGEQILDALARLGLKSEQIDTIVNTHDHPDHCGNNSLFSGARIISPKEGEVIAPGVRAIETPGHTMDSISIVVEGPQTIVIAGDAMPTFGNFQKNVPPFIHVDRTLAVSSMARIINLADIVVPGHDLPFSVLKRSTVQLPIRRSAAGGHTH